MKKKVTTKKTKSLQMKTGVKAGFCKYLFYSGDMDGFVDCIQKYGRW